jgi:GNAT superfamily N-acetyltransferase
VGEVELSVVDGASGPAQWAMRQYFDELARRFPGGFDPGGALDEAAELFNPPRGVFVLAVVDGRTAGCGALVHLDDGTAEIKRMWVSPAIRGLGVGARLLSRLEDEAAHAGRRRVVLDTNGTLTEAIAMYGSRGYVPIERYNDNPYAQRWFEKALT